MPFRSPGNPDAGGGFTAPLVYLSGGEKPLEKPQGQDAVPRKASGRPAHEPTEATRREVRGAAARFIPHGAIAALVEISRKTLLKHHQEELALGDAQGCARGAMALSKLIEEGSEKGSAHDLLEIAR